MSEQKVIAASVYDPRQPSIFGKAKKSERATYSEILCSCESCPLRAKRQCVQISIFRSYCPYGDYRTESGPTQRAGSYYGWVRDKQEQAKQHGGWLVTATNKLAFIGEYVYIPYSFADMCEAVLPRKRPFLKREDWTLEAVLKLIDFRPRALFTSEVIKDYQKESVPLLIAHIRELDPDMWQQLIAARPELDVAPNYVGRKAILKTLAAPISIPAYDNRYPVPWVWDGEYATTTSFESYEKTWGHIKAESLVLKVKPKDDATVKVADNSWVTPETIFVD